MQVIKFLFYFIRGEKAIDKNGNDAKKFTDHSWTLVTLIELLTVMKANPRKLEVIRKYPQETRL